MYKAFHFLISLLIFTACGTTENGSQKSGGNTIPTEAHPPEKNQKVIVFFGNSLTAGYGLKMSEAYPALIQERLDSLGLDYLVVNAGVSGETSATGNSRIDWVLESPLDIFVLELGGNDGLRGISTEETYKNLQSIIEKVKTRYPDAEVILAGMQVPPNMGKPYADRFAEIFPRLSNRLGIRLIPFLLEGVGGERDLNLPDGIHPTAEGHRIVAETVWDSIRDLLEVPELQ